MKKYQKAVNILEEGVHKMKRLFLFLSLIVIFSIIYISIINFDQIITIHYLNKQAPIVIKLAYLLPMTLFMGLIIGSGIIYLFLKEEQTKVKAYKRELEKSSITGTTNASKVEVLEAKIKTLETAFNNVVDDRTKLEIQIKSLNAEIESMNKKKN